MKGAGALVVLGFAGHAVANKGDNEVVLGVGEGGGGLDAAVAKGGGGRVVAKVVGHGVGAVVVGIGDKTEAPVDDVLKGVVKHIFALAPSEGDDGFGFENGRTIVEEGFVEVAQLSNGAARATPGAAEGCAFFGV